MRLALAAFAAILLSASAQADDVDCANQQDQATMNVCAGRDFEAADKKLNADFKEIEKRLGDDPDTKKLLVASQRAWIAFRDAECTFQASGVSGGTIYPMILSNCRATLTNDRVAELKTYLSCEDGDMSCPVPAAQ